MSQPVVTRTEAPPELHAQSTSVFPESGSAASSHGTSFATSDRFTLDKARDGLAMIVADVSATWSVSALALGLAHLVQPQAGPWLWASFAWTTTWFVVQCIMRAYPGYGVDSAERLRYTAMACLVSWPAFATSHLATHPSVLPVLLALSVSTALGIPASLAARTWTRSLLMARGAWGVKVVVVGEGYRAQSLKALLAANPEYGYREVTSGAADLAIVALPSQDEAERERLLEGPLGRFRRVLVVTRAPALDANWAGARHLGVLMALELRRRHLEPSDLRLKRALDLLLALVLLPFVAPVMLIIALAVAVDSRGPVFYLAPRLGLKGSSFMCWKFRTMHRDAEERLADLLERDEEARQHYEAYHKLPNDPRVTRVGRFLRRTSLDELPQVVNVLLGDMSFVGPRPYLPREKPVMGAHVDTVLSCRPGITGWWQVSARNTARFDERVRMDLHYVRRWSPWLDLQILGMTPLAVLKGKGAS